jgi:hypothetical protein
MPRRINNSDRMHALEAKLKRRDSWRANPPLSTSTASRDAQMRSISTVSDLKKVTVKIGGPPATRATACSEPSQRLCGLQLRKVLRLDSGPLRRAKSGHRRRRLSPGT